MKTSLVSLLAAGCIAMTLAAAEPDASPSSPAAAPSSAGSAAPDASPSATPVRHHHHHAAPVAATPTPTPVPKKHWWWERKPEVKASPSPMAKAAPSPEAKPSPSPVAKALPSPTAKPKKRSENWFSGLFKPRPKKYKTVLVVKPTPSPAPHKHHAVSEESQPGPSPAATPEETSHRPPAPEATPTPEATPEEHKSGGMTEQVPFVAPAEKTEAPVVETKTPAEEEAEESSRFQAAKTKALQDQNLQDLQAKADSATGEDAKTATRRYYRALYDKMREIDPSIKDRIDRTEAATLRRVEQETQ